MFYHFNDWTLDLVNFRLFKDEDVIDIRPKTFKLLCYFAKHNQRLITRDELFEALWPGRCVSDESLTTCIKELRKILGDSHKQKQYIVTRHKLGYQFLPEVNTETKAEPQNIPFYRPPVLHANEHYHSFAL